jgi:hypothetical protein
MFKAFWPEGTRAAFERLLVGRLPIAGAELQGLLLAGDDEDANVAREVAA